MDYKNFAKQVYIEFEGRLSSDEIDAILNIKDSFNIDSPVSTDKRLIIRNIKIIGNDASQNAEFKLDYQEGVNILIADNLKGKSSIFKMIKYALTGKNSLKDDIKERIQYLFLNFSISQKDYTVVLDLRKSRLLAKLFYGSVNSLEDTITLEDKKIFETKSGVSFEDRIQEFFFNQFSYYSLKWTQKDSRKTSTRLNEAGASWKTYFKSVLLESKDSDSLLYGNQGKKIFEMLLGMELTYPLNRLEVKREKLRYKKSQNLEFQNIIKDNTANDIEEWKKKIKNIDEKLEKLSVENSVQKKISQLTNQFNISLETVERNNQERLDKHSKLEALSSYISGLKQDIELLTISKRNIEKEISSSLRQKNSLEEFIQIGAFFSNLDIKQCPACEQSLLESKKQESIQKHECSLCHEDVSSKKVDISIYENKITDLDALITSLKQRLIGIESELNSATQTLSDKSAELKIVKDELRKLPDSTIVNNQLAELEQKISSLRKEESKNDIKNDLIGQKAVYEYKLQEIESNDSNPLDSLNLELEVLDSAILKLSEQRAQLGKKVTNRLSSLMTQEVQALGLDSVTKVIINDNLDVKYEQSGAFISFDDFAEGEQLRAKIAFYLSLIQMDIEFNLGRHTRLLMIDSPAKEEGDNAYLEGLSKLLKSIEERFGNELQILIATAERDLENVITNQKVIPTGQYVF